MKILALDISSISTGFCVFNKGRLNKGSCGTINPNPRRSYGERLTIFAKEVEILIEKHRPDLIIIEDVFKGRSMKTFKVLCMFRGVAIQAIFKKTGKDPMSLMASETRSVVGIKNTKEEVFKYITKKYKLKNYNFIDHNDICDAIALALAAHKIQKQGIDVRSLRNTKRKKRRKRK